MDIANLILNSGAPLQTTLEPVKKTDSASEAEKIQSAKDFESVFINKLLDEMKNTIGDWGEEKDGPAQQVDGIFWLYLSRDIADQGGFGMWKDIYKLVNNSEQKNTTSESLDKKL
jgi:Rod binding domain-containing protein